MVPVDWEPLGAIRSHRSAPSTGDYTRVPKFPGLTCWLWVKLLPPHNQVDGSFMLPSWDCLHRHKLGYTGTRDSGLGRCSPPPDFLLYACVSLSFYHLTLPHFSSMTTSNLLSRSRLIYLPTCPPVCPFTPRYYHHPEPHCPSPTRIWRYAPVKISGRYARVSIYSFEILYPRFDYSGSTRIRYQEGSPYS